jgi:hypothetical protein
VGATKQEDYGNFYAYGEIEPKEEYTFENYKWRYEDWNEWDDDEWEKYFKLGATYTGTNYDVAHVKWGDKWRTPTKDEWDELINNCTWTWTGINGVTGALATSNITGNSIFFPAAGNMVDADHTHDQLGCFLWTSSEYVQTDISEECRNYRANIDSSNHSADGYDYPEVGFNVRAVYGDYEEELDEVVVPTDDQMVDLGLSVKWAPFNVGASSSGSTGGYYCWGEVNEKQYSHVYNYKYYDPLIDSYVELPDHISGTDYDVAKVLWGNGWRLPTQAEFQELIDKCTWTASTNGYTVTGPNGNSIFLKTDGMMTYKGAPRETYLSGFYMSGDAMFRSNGDLMPSVEVALRFTRGISNVLGAPSMSTGTSRAAGISVRPVHD